jgi:molybdopterin converting factor small subunit
MTLEKCVHHDECTRRIVDLEARMDSAEMVLKTLEVEGAAKAEQIRTVFSVLAEIKEMLKDYTERMEKSIGRLATDIETLKGRPGRFADGALVAFITAIIGAAVGWVVARGGK